MSSSRHIARGAAWLYSYRWIDKLLGFVSITVLARILLKEDFGLVAIAASFVWIVEGLSEFDVKNALIQSRDEDRELYDSAWTLSSLRGLLVAAVLVCVAPFVGDPRLTKVLYVLALAPLLDGLANPRFVMFERDLIYSRLALQTLSATTTSFLVTVGIAVVYKSYWALVLGVVAASSVRTLVTYVLKPYRPRVSFERWGGLFRFSGWMSLAGAVSTLATRTDRIIVGSFLGYADAGAYDMTQRISVLPTGELISPLQRILFPSFSQMLSEPARLRRAVCQSINIAASLSLPAAVGFALIASDFVPLVLGERWVSIAPLLMVLVPLLGLRATLSSARSCVMALGRTRLMFVASFVYALFHLPLFVLGTWRFGLTGAIWSIVVAGVPYAYLDAWLLKKTLAISVREILAQLQRPACAVAVMVLTVGMVQAMLPIDLFSERGSWLALVTKVVVGAVAYCASQLFLWQRAGRPEGFEQRLLQLLSSRQSRG